MDENCSGKTTYWILGRHGVNATGAWIVCQLLEAAREDARPPSRLRTACPRMEGELICEPCLDDATPDYDTDPDLIYANA